MEWVKIKRKSVEGWNEKLKKTNASFFQYPYYAEGYNHFLFSKSRYFKLADGVAEKAYCHILEIGALGHKIGLIIRGPVIIDYTISLVQAFDTLASLARQQKYVFLRVNPDDDIIKTELDKHPFFKHADYFPLYKGSQSVNFNVHRVEEKDLLASFRRDCRQKIKFANQLQYEFATVKNKTELKAVYQLFVSLGNNKKFKYRPYKSYLKIFEEGNKHDLCSVYTATLENRLICAAFIVKDASSFHYLSGALQLGDIRAKDSPSNKLQYLIMQDCFYLENKPKYNLSYSDPHSSVFMFKDSFHPVVEYKPSYYTYVSNIRLANLILKLQKEHIEQLKLLLRNLFKKVKG